MASIASRTFAVAINENSNILPRASRRVILNAELLRSAKATTGDLVVLISQERPSCRQEFAVGVLWPSVDVHTEQILVSTSLLLTAGLVVGQAARVAPISDKVAWKLLPYLPSFKPCVEAGFVHLKEIFSAKGPATTSHTPTTFVREDEWLRLTLREILVDLKYIVDFQVIDLSYQGQQRCFRVQEIAIGRHSPQPGSLLSDDLDKLSIEKSTQLWQVGWDCSVLVDDSSLSSEATLANPSVELLPHSQPHDSYSGVGGLDKQIDTIRDLLEIPLTKPELFRHLGLKAPRGILLHGPPGTGKTHLARAIASSTKSSVLVVNGPELSSAYHGETESKLRDVFKQAREKSPCIVVLDEVDALVPKREESAGGEVEKRVVATLLTILDGMGQDHNSGLERVVIIGTTNRPNAIDPALRRPGRFDQEIEIGIPDADARFAILTVLLRKTPHAIPVEQLRSLASHMYGYVGADIEAVVREAGTLAIKKWVKSRGYQPQPHPIGSLVLEFQDLVDALPGVRPSAMRSLFLETAPVRYSDIGGQASVIQKLKEAVEWPLLHPEAFQRLGVKPPKGILLFGPPGCSKTVLARACACESGVNFVAVKGPEVLNKYVGESERAVREIFRKARAASPSIIFFDEIDALGASRTASDSDRGSSHEGVLTSLLNEMDGVQELAGVTIIAATNRPEFIDSALIRPGRLDRILWVGPPDLQGREEILKIRTKTMSVGPDLNIPSIAQRTDGYSGAEITSLCQEAAILTMHEDIHAHHVPQSAFLAAAGMIKKQITPDMLHRFDLWRSGCAAQLL